MKQQTEWDETCEIDDLPVSSTVTVLRPSKYGSLADLPDEELADPAELEQQAITQAWGPILALPVKGERGAFHPSVDELGKVEGAFGSVDFDRVKAKVDKSRWKEEELKEERRNVLISLGIVKERLPGLTKYRVLKGLAKGTIRLDDIVGEDMRQLARLVLRARKLRKKILALREKRLIRRQRKALAWLEA